MAALLLTLLHLHYDFIIIEMFVSNMLFVSLMTVFLLNILSAARSVDSYSLAFVVAPLIFLFERIQRRLYI